jgi:hypothetical protein
VPAFVKTKADEAIWQRAKKEYKDNAKVPKDEDRWTDKDWATVTTIFKNIRGGAASRLARIAKTCHRR